MKPQAKQDRYSAGGGSFLPEDYVEQRAERRTNVFALTLFAVVMTAVVAAFLVTNQRWNSVKSQQQAINVSYTKAAKEIEQLKLLEEQQQTKMHKAELTGALIERVPRSVLLAELINRMPEDVTLLEFELETKAPKKRRVDPKAGHGTKDLAKRKTKKEAITEGEQETIEVPTYETSLDLVGVAPTDVEVSQYIASLNACPLLSQVTLKYSENSMVEEQMLREFRIAMRLDPIADARELEPLLATRSGRIQGDDEELTFGELPDALRSFGQVFKNDASGQDGED